MKKKYMKLIGSIVLAFCLVVTGVVATINAQAEGEESTGIDLYFSEEPVKYVADGNSLSVDGYLFAGWYNRTGDGKTTQVQQTDEEGNPATDEEGNPIYDEVTVYDADDYTAVSSPKAEESYYVKYVPEEMLGVKAQVSKNIISSEGDVTQTAKNAIRFLTSLDSTNYKDVGFEISIGGAVQDTETKITNKVYEVIYAIGATEATEENKEQYTAKEAFGNDASKYFKTYTITDVPAGGFDTDINVTPYYVTYDGTKVYGTETIRSVDFCCGNFYVSSKAYESGAANAGTKNSPAKLETAVAIPVDTKLVTPTVYIVDDITMQKQATVSKSMTIVGVDKTDVETDDKRITITGSSDGTYSSSCLIRVSDGAKNVTINNVIIDGTALGDKSPARAISVAAAGSESEPILIKDSLLQNFTYQGGDYGHGGLIWTKGYVVLSNSTLQNSSTIQSSDATDRGNGGLVYVAYDSNTAETVASTFKITDNSVLNGGSCAVDGEGGCVYVATNTSLLMESGTIKNGQVEGKTKINGNGGNIYCDGTFTMTGGEITNGKAITQAKLDRVGCGGNVFLNTNGELSMSGGTIDSGVSTTNSETYTDTSYESAFGGGNICSYGSKVTISGSAVIKEGEATNRGGNILMAGVLGDTCTLNIQNATAPTGETATLSGGTADTGASIFANRCTTTIENVTKLSGGTATTSGGFLHMWAGTASFKDVEISGGSAKNGGCVYVTGNATYIGELTMYNGATITGGNATNGGCVYITCGSSDGKCALTMNTGAKIQNGSATTGHGGNVYLDYANFTMNGGTIQNGLAGTNGNTGTSQGGNVYVNSARATININEGSIIDGKAGRRGGNLYLGNQKVTLGSGVIKITGGETGKIDASTKAIANPTVSNVFLFAGASINSFAIAEGVTLNAESRIGVNSSAGTDVVQYFVTNATQDFEVLKQIFSSDVSTKAIYKDTAKNSLYMTAVATE